MDIETHNKRDKFYTSMVIIGAIIPLLFVLAVGILLAASLATLTYADTNHPTCGTPATGSNCMGAGNATQDTCIDTTGNNAMDSTDTCHDDVECYNGHIGASCDQSPGTTGVCVKNSGTTAICGTTPVSGEYGTGLSGGTSATFHSGNENSTCTTGAIAMACSMTGGYDPTVGGACDSASCMMSGYLVCGSVCEVSDVSATNYVTSCSASNRGASCDSAITGSGGWTQDGFCVGDNTCGGAGGYVCNSTGILTANGCGGACSEGSTCDATFSGDYDSSYGTCVSGSCTAASNAVPNITTPILNDTGINDHEDIKSNTTYSDKEADAGTVFFIWFINNKSVQTNTFTGVSNNSVITANLSQTFFTKGSQIIVQVNATDTNANNAASKNSTAYLAEHCNRYKINNRTNGIEMFSVNCEGDLTVTDRIIFRLRETIDNLIDGWLTITGNLDITGIARWAGYGELVNSSWTNHTLDTELSGYSNISQTVQPSWTNYTLDTELLGYSNISQTVQPSWTNYTLDSELSSYINQSQFGNGTHQLTLKGGANISLAGQIATLNASCATITGSAGLCDGDDATGAGGASPINSTGTNTYLNATENSFGIGTTTPSQKLEVAGHTNITGNLTIAGSFHIDKINSTTIRMWFG